MRPRSARPSLLPRCLGTGLAAVLGLGLFVMSAFDSRPASAQTPLYFPERPKAEGLLAGCVAAAGLDVMASISACCRLIPSLMAGR